MTPPTRRLLDAISDVGPTLCRDGAAKRLGFRYAPDDCGCGDCDLTFGVVLPMNPLMNAAPADLAHRAEMLARAIRRDSWWGGLAYTANLLRALAAVTADEQEAQ